MVSWLTELLRRAAQRRRNYHNFSHFKAAVIISYAQDFHRLFAGTNLLVLEGLGLFLNCMSLQIFEIHKFQSTHVSGFDVNLRCHPMIQCFFPAGHT